ncbi:MAG: flagellar hook-basal body protein [Verrucomicrobiota bacterium]
MDVIGNNISNVNTVGYKSRRTAFSESFSQVSRSATSSTPVGLSIGLGSNVVGTETSFTQGAFQRTNIETDVAIGGDGFFCVMTGMTAAADGTSGSGERYFTRAGNFVTDLDGYLRTADGNYVQGYSVVADDAAADQHFTDTYTFVSSAVVVDSTDPGGAVIADTSLYCVRIPTDITYTGGGGSTERIKSFSIATDGAISVVGENGTNMVIGYMCVTNFGNDNGLTYKFGNYYQSSVASGDPEYWRANDGPVGTTQSGALELANVDLASQFADMIITQRGFDANARTVNASDEMLQTAVNLKR